MSRCKVRISEAIFNPNTLHPCMYIFTSVFYLKKKKILQHCTAIFNQIDIIFFIFTIFLSCVQSDTRKVTRSIRLITFSVIISKCQTHLELFEINLFDVRQTRNIFFAYLSILNCQILENKFYEKINEVYTELVISIEYYKAEAESSVLNG